MDESGEHHSQQTDTEQKMKYRMFSLIGGCGTMRIHGHREGNITNRALLGVGGVRGGIAGNGRLGRDNIRRNT